MGQLIQTEQTVVGNTVLFHADRSITGQDGTSFDSAVAAADGAGFAARLAARLFEALETVDHVFVASNQVVLRRPGAWDQEGLDTAAGVIEEFFLYYPAPGDA